MKYDHKGRPFSDLTASLLCSCSLCPLFPLIASFHPEEETQNGRMLEPTEVSMRFLVGLNGNAKARGLVLSFK